MYGNILNFVHSLSKKICNYLQIPVPRVYIYVAQDTGDLTGAMAPKPKESEMYIELLIPHDITLKRDKALLTAIVLHEHCHYYDSIRMTRIARQKSIKAYANSAYKRRLDEKRTWRCTKRLAKKLGLWSYAIFTEISRCEFASEITY